MDIGYYFFGVEMGWFIGGCGIGGRWSSSGAAFKVIDDAADVLLDDAVLQAPEEALTDALRIGRRQRLAAAQTGQIVRAVRADGRRPVEERPRREGSVEAHREAARGRPAVFRQEGSIVQRQPQLRREVAASAHALHVTHTAK